MLNKKVIIRVDGNSSIGLGHLYRGIALAEILKERYNIEFVTKISTTISPIKESGFSLTYIPSTVSFSEEPIWIKNNYVTDSIIVLDGYEFTEYYQQKIKKFNFKLVYIDDFAKGIQKADLVINHSPNAQKSNYKCEYYTKLALGLEYALLRKRFINFDRNKIKSKNKIETIFISFGGADTHDFTHKSAQALLKISSIKKINIVLGAAYKNKAVLEIRSPKIHIHNNLQEQNIFNLMKDTDLAITSASTTSIELASLGTPMILGYFTDNQIGIYNGFINKKAVKPIGDLKKYNFENLFEEITNIKKEGLLNILQTKTLMLFNGKIDDNIRNKFKKL